MPLLKLETTVPLADNLKNDLLPALSRIVGETIGKPEDYVMITASPTAMMMSGKAEQAAFVDIRSIGGLSADVNRKLSQKVCAVLHELLGIPENRIYLNFTDVSAKNWGWNGATFG